MFLYFQGVGLRNRLKRLATRLHSPRYLLATLAGVGYFVLILGPRVWGRGNAGSHGSGGVPVPLEVLAPFGLALLVVFWWLWGGYEDALAFTPAEVALLFPAPLRRTDLIRFKLMRFQLALSFTVLFFSLMLPGALPWYMRLLSLWLLVSTLQLHQLAASLVRVSAQQGGRGLRHAIVPLTLFALAATGLVYTASSAYAAVQHAGDPAGVFQAARAALEQPVARIVLLPFHVVLAPLLAASPAAWARAIPAAVAVLGLHYVWVVRTDAAFEEAAAAAGLRRAERIAAKRAGRRVAVRRPKQATTTTPLRLRPNGRPAVAIVWKNVIAFLRRFRPATGLFVLGALAAFFALMSLKSGSIAEAARSVSAIAAGYAGFLSLMAPMMFRNDLRTDLQRIELLRTYPLSGVQVVAAEITASTVAIEIVQLGLLVVAGVLLPFAGLAPARLAATLGFGALGAIALPPVNAMIVTIQNGMAILFPAWSTLGMDRPSGVEAMGQNMLTMLGSILLLALSLVAPAVIGGVVAISLEKLMGVWATAPAGLVAWTALWGELALLVAWLGRAYDGIDPVEAGLVR